MKAVHALERPATAAGSILAAVSLFLLVVSALRPAGIVVLVTAGLVLASFGLSVAEVAWQERRSARRERERADEFTRRNRGTGTRGMEKEATG